MSLFQKKYQLKIHSFQQTKEVLNNPNRGFHRIVLLDVSKEKLHDDYFQNYPFALVLVEFNLKKFSKIDLTEEAILNISKTFEIINKANKHAIVRFAYDFEGNGMRNEPSSIQRIFKHIEQIKPILEYYKETIFLIQGLFVGSWGEMHHSKFLSENAINQLYQKLDTDIYVAVRTPALHRMLNNMSIGIFNDGFCSSEDDLGTYPENRNQDYEYQSKIMAPMGGETACLSSYNDIENVIHSMRTLHFTYLNEEYHQDVIAKWKSSTYHHQNGFDYILNHLGYRYIIGKVQAKMKKDTLIGKIDIDNVGFAPIYQKMNIYLKIDDKEKLLDENLTFEIDFSKEEPGQYEIYLHIETETKQEIFLGNNGYNQEKQGYCILTLEKK